MTHKLSKKIRTILFLKLVAAAVVCYAQSPKASSLSNPANSYISKKKEGDKEGVRGGCKEEVKIDCSCFRNYSCSFAAAWLCTHPEDNKQSLPTVFPQPNSLPNQK